MKKEINNVRILKVEFLKMLTQLVKKFNTK